MKILVTGGAGYIGSHTVRELLKEGYDVTILDNLENGHKESIPEGIKFVKIDLRDEDNLDRVFAEGKFEAVIHFAAYIEAGESMFKPLKYFNNNTKSAINLLCAMLNHGVDKIIFSSTAAVYGEPKEIPITEETEKNPTNYYGASKLMVERILETVEKANGIKSISLRYFNASGAGYDVGEDHSPETHLIPLILQVPLGKRESIKVFGTDYPTPDGSCVRDYIHVMDLAKAHVLALKALFDGKTGKYNLGSGEGYSVKEVIRISRLVTAHPIPVEEVERRPGDPAVLVASSDKIKKELGWQPEYNLKQIIQSAWEWHKAHPHGFLNHKY